MPGFSQVTRPRAAAAASAPGNREAGGHDRPGTGPRPAPADPGTCHPSGRLLPGAADHAASPCLTWISASVAPAARPSPSWPKSRCFSPRRSGPRNSTSSPSRCAGPPASLPPCTRAPWKASARPPTWSPRDDACTACPPPASPRSPGPPGGPHRTSLLLPLVSAVARRRHLRPRAGHRQLRKNHVPPTRLARHPETDGALTGPDTVHPVVTPLPGLSLRPVRRPNAFCPWSRRRRPRYGRCFR